MDALAQVSSMLLLVPAYGRKYKNKQEVLKDWYTGKDFKIVNGPYCSVRDLDRLRSSQPSGIYITFNNETIFVE